MNHPNSHGLEILPSSPNVNVIGLVPCNWNRYLAVKGDGYVVDCNGRRRLCKTTAGVKLQVALRSDDKITKTWLPLKDLKEFNPFEVAEFVKAGGLDKKPAFKW